MTDVIQRLRELRQSSQSSVVTGIETTASDHRPSIAHPLAPWLENMILDQLTDPAGAGLSLIVLSGNAGDGKSYLLREIRQRLVDEEGPHPGMVKWLLDATESTSQTESSVDRLDEFFGPFADSEDWQPPQLHVVAMNTGTVVRFIAHAAESGAFATLRDVLRVQLGIEACAEHSGNEYWERFDRVLVVDLDRRMLLPLDDEEESFVDRMFSVLDISQPSGFLASASTNCSDCSFSDRCPVRVNLTGLRHPVVRKRFKVLLRDIMLEDRIHIGPRGLWHIMYQMTVGGLDAQTITLGRPLVTCADIGGTDDDTRARALFFTALFEHTHEAADTGAPALFGELGRVDPAKRFTIEANEHALAAGLSASEDCRLCEPFSAELGLAAELLCGSPDSSSQRSAAAVRRAFFLQQDDPDPIRHEWLAAWTANLLEYSKDVLDGGETRHDTVSLLVGVLTEIHESRARRGLWHLQLPWRHLTELHTQLDLRPGRRRRIHDVRILGPDHCRPSGLRVLAHELAEKLAAYALAIQVPLRNGPDVRISWPLFRLLRQVHDLHYAAASLDPERVQNLGRIGASLGAQASVDRGVAVLGEAGWLVCEDDGAGGYDVVDL